MSPPYGSAATAGSAPPSSALPISPGANGIRIAVRLTPRASRDGIDGIVMGPDGRTMLQLRIVAPPVDGAANAALIAYLAKAIGIRRSAIRILSGERSRQKLLHLEGDATALQHAVAALVK